MSLEHAVGGSSNTADPWTLDLGTHEFSAGNRVLFFIGMHGTSPAINSIEFQVNGTPTGVFLSKSLAPSGFTIPGQAYWELWWGTLPQTATTYDLIIDPVSSIAGGAGYQLFEINSPVVEIGPFATGSYSGLVTPMPVVDVNRAALILLGAHNDSNYLNTSTVSDGFTVTAAASRQLLAYRLVTGPTTTAAEVDWDGASEAGEALMVAVYVEILIEDNAEIPPVIDHGCVAQSGGGQSAGGCVNAFPTIGTQEECAGGGTVPTRADLIHSETWWGRA